MQIQALGRHFLSFGVAMIAGLLGVEVRAIDAGSAFETGAVNLAPGLEIVDGGSDLFDGFGSVQFRNSSAGFANWRYDGAVTGAPPTITGSARMSPEWVARGWSAEVTGQIHCMTEDGEPTSAVDAPIIRWWYRIQNNGSNPINLSTLRLPGRGDLGSDNSTQVNQTSSGDSALGLDDFWVVTSDGQNGVVDPAFGFLFSSGGSPNLQPDQVAIPSNGFMSVDFDAVTLPAGEAVSFVFFGCARTSTGDSTTGRSTVTQATELVTGLLLETGEVDSKFLTSSPLGDVTEIQNMAFAIEPAPVPAPVPGLQPNPTPIRTPSPTRPELTKPDLKIDGKAKISTERKRVRLAGRITGGGVVRRVEIQVGKIREKTVKVGRNGNWKTKVLVPPGSTRIRVTAISGKFESNPQSIEVTR